MSESGWRWTCSLHPGMVPFIRKLPPDGRRNGLRRPQDLLLVGPVGVRPPPPLHSWDGSQQAEHGQALQVGHGGSEEGL